MDKTKNTSIKLRNPSKANYIYLKVMNYIIHNKMATQHGMVAYVNITFQSICLSIHGH